MERVCLKNENFDIPSFDVYNYLRFKKFSMKLKGVY